MQQLDHAIGDGDGPAAERRLDLLLVHGPVHLEQVGAEVDVEVVDAAQGGEEVDDLGVVLGGRVDLELGAVQLAQPAGPFRLTAPLAGMDRRDDVADDVVDAIEAGTAAGSVDQVADIVHYRLR